MASFVSPHREHLMKSVGRAAIEGHLGIERPKDKLHVASHFADVVAHAGYLHEADDQGSKNRNDRKANCNPELSVSHEFFLSPMVSDTYILT